MACSSYLQPMQPKQPSSYHHSTNRNSLQLAMARTGAPQPRKAEAQQESTLGSVNTQSISVGNLATIQANKMPGRVYQLWIAAWAPRQPKM